MAFIIIFSESPPPLSLSRTPSAHFLTAPPPPSLSPYLTVTGLSTLYWNKCYYNNCCRSSRGVVCVLYRFSTLISILEITNEQTDEHAPTYDATSCFYFVFIFYFSKTNSQATVRIRTRTRDEPTATRTSRRFFTALWNPTGTAWPGPGYDWTWWFSRRCYWSGIISTK